MVADAQQCALRPPEPPICPQLPYREGLKYIGTEGGLQRYTCAGNQLARLVINGDQTVHAKYVECNSTFYRAKSESGHSFTSQSPITAFNCRDYGKLEQGCSTPIYMNAWLQNGNLRCLKGFYPAKIYFLNGDNPLDTSAGYQRIVSAKCEGGVWKVEGLVYPEVQLSYFDCRATPSTAEPCGPLSITPRNVQFAELEVTYQEDKPQYFCSDATSEEMEVVTPGGAAFYGYKLVCENKEWKFIGVDTVTIPANSKVSCKPRQMGVLPPFPPSLPLIPIGKTPEGLTRWTCIDSTVTLDIEFHTDQGKRMPVHATYIDANNTFYRFSSSIDFKSYTSSTKIKSISCTDMGSKHAACTDPWDIGGIRKGNRYECMKGFALNYIKYVNAQGAEVMVYTTQTDTKSMECTTAGWKLEGTALTGLSVSAFHCYDVSQYSGESACAALNVTMENYKLQYDYYRKYFTCDDGRILGYNIISAQTKKMYCGMSSSGGVEWKWSFMDGTDEAAIPLGSKMNCF